MAPSRQHPTPRDLAQVIEGLLLGCAIIILTSLLVSEIDESASLNLGLASINLGNTAALLAYWYVALRGRAPGSCFGVILLFSLAIFRIISVGGLIAFGASMEWWPPTVTYPERVLEVYSQGEALTSIGALLLVATWQIVTGRDLHAVGLAMPVACSSTDKPIAMYLIAIVAEGSRRLLGFDFGALQQIFSIASLLGVASIYYLSASRSTFAHKILSSVALAIPLVAVGLGSGMKEAVLFPLLPATFLAWTEAKVQLRIAIAVAGVLLLMILQAYVGYVRNISWDSETEYRTSELLDGFRKGFGEVDFSNIARDLSMRLNLSTAHAITVQIYNEQGYFPDEVLLAIPASFVPRLLWPEKPVLQPGALHTARILGVPSERVDEMTSATAPGFFVELYLGAGWASVVGGSLLYGFAFAKLQQASARKSDPYWAKSLIFLAAFWAIRFDENHVAYAFTGLFFFYVFMSLVSKIKSTKHL